MEYKDTHLTALQRERARVILLLDSATTHKKAFAGCGDGGLVKDDIYVCWVGEGATWLIQPLKTTVKNSKLTDQHYWLNRVKIARHAALEFNHGWSFVEEFTRCGFSVYGRVHKSRLHFKLRSFLEERGWDGGNKRPAERTPASPQKQPSPAKDKLILREEIQLTTGEQRATDATYDKSKTGVAAQSEGQDKLFKKKSLIGEPATQLGGVDADLPQHAQKQLEETGAFQDFYAFPWAVVRANMLSGTPLPLKGSGYASYLVTWASPKKKDDADAAAGKEKKKLKPGETAAVFACPTSITDKVWLERVWEACQFHDVSLKKSVARRERPKGREHLHAAATSGNSNFRFRYGRIATMLRLKYNMFTNWCSVSWPAAVNYISCGSSRKWQFDFVGEPLIHYAASEQLETIEEICLGANLCNISSEPFTFPEFRQLVEDKKVTRLDQLHRATKSCPRLDKFVNGNGGQPDLPRKRLNSALQSIKMRDSTPVTLIDKLLGAVSRTCVCGGRQVAAVKKWSLTIRWSDRCKRSEDAVGIQAIHWALTGRQGGNTLVFYGRTGTGKTWWMNMIKACLDALFFGPTSGDKSYPWERLGLIFPLRLALLFDEWSKGGLSRWLTQGDDGWWKEWLNAQTARSINLGLPKNKEFDREEFDDPAPVAYVGTKPIRLKAGDDEFKTEKAARRENEQAARRELLAHCRKKVCKGPKKAIPVCGHCFAKYLVEVNQRHQIYCPETQTRLSTDVEKEPKKHSEEKKKKKPPKKSKCEGLGMNHDELANLRQMGLTAHQIAQIQAMREQPNAPAANVPIVASAPVVNAAANAAVEPVVNAPAANAAANVPIPAVGQHINVPVVPAGQPINPEEAELMRNEPWRGNVGEWEEKYLTCLSGEMYNDARTWGAITRDDRRTAFECKQGLVFNPNFLRELPLYGRYKHMLIYKCFETAEATITTFNLNRQRLAQYGIVFSLICVKQHRYGWNDKQDGLLGRVARNLGTTTAELKDIARQYTIPAWEGGNGDLSDLE
eukprot:g19054.t1